MGVERAEGRDSEGERVGLVGVRPALATTFEPRSGQVTDGRETDTKGRKGGRGGRGAGESGRAGVGLRWG